MAEFNISWSDIIKARPNWTVWQCNEFLLKYRHSLEDAVYSGMKHSIDKFILGQEEITRLENE